LAQDLRRNGKVKESGEMGGEEESIDLKRERAW